MKTLIQTQKKFTVRVKEAKDINSFIQDIHNLAKSLKEESQKGFKLVEVSLDALNQTINATVTNSKERDEANQKQNPPMPQGQNRQTLPQRPSNQEK